MASSAPDPLRRKSNLYGGLGEPPGPPGMAPRLLEFADELRSEGMAVGTSELLDGFRALEAVSWTDRAEFREALSATLAKSQEDRRVLELVFDRFFFRAAEREALEQGVREADAQAASDGGDRMDMDALREAIRNALQSDETGEGQMRDLARLAIAAFGRQGEGSGVIGVDVQRIRRTLDLKGEQGGTQAEPDPDAVPRDRLREFERHVRRELERALIERTEALPPSRPLNELDRALPTGAAQDLAEVHRVVAQLRRRLATQGRQNRGRSRTSVVDVRSTMRASLSTGGVRSSCATGPGAPAGRSCSCSATCRRR